MLRCGDWNLIWSWEVRTNKKNKKQNKFIPNYHPPYTGKGIADVL